MNRHQMWKVAGVPLLFCSLAKASSITIFDPPGSTFTIPSGITAAGVIIGDYVDANGVTHGFLRTPDGSFTTSDVPGSTSTTPTGINAAGVIVGSYLDANGVGHGFVQAPDRTFTTFDAPAGGSIGGPIYIPGGPPPSITPAGDIAGTYLAPDFVQHGFLRRRDGTFTTIDVPGASIFTQVFAINPAGVILGAF